MDDAALAAAEFLYSNTEWRERILKYEYQVNILWNEETGKYYITDAYTDGEWGEVNFQAMRPNDSFGIVATLHTHSQIKDDLDSVFSKDKNNLPKYEKYVLETDGMRGRLVYYNREKDMTQPKFYWGEWDE